MAGVGDVGNLLTSLGFALPTIDQEALNVDYVDPFVLMQDLKAMGEQHAPSDRTRRKYTPWSTIAAAAAIYKTLYSHKVRFLSAFEISLITPYFPWLKEVSLIF